MPSPRYTETRVAKLGEAWTLLSGGEGWEISERRPGGRLLLGRPSLRPRAGLRAASVARHGGAVEGQNGVVIDLPDGFGGASWVETDDDARQKLNEVLAAYAMNAGEERLYRLRLVIDGEVREEQLAAAGEITPDPEILDALSLTYLGVLLSVALAIAFGPENLEASARIVLGVASFVGLAVLLRAIHVRRTIRRFSHWALPGAHDDRV